MTNDALQLVKDKYKDRVFCVASPSPEKTDFRFNISLMELVTQNIALFQMRLQKAVSSRIAVNRNTIVGDARAAGATDILWIDTDTKFPAHGLVKLVQHDKDIVCATTVDRLGTGLPIGTAFEPGVQASVVKMRMVGFPFMLTSMKVFDKMDELWPERKGTYFAEPPRWAFPQVDTVKDGLIAEDEYFCHYVREAGFDIWCDMELSVEIGHIGTTVYYISSENIIKEQAVKVDEVL